MISRKFLLPAAVFLSIFTGVLVLGLGANSLVNVYRDGTVIDENYRGNISTITGFKQEHTGESYYMNLQGNCNPSGLALISVHSAPDMLYINGREVVFNTFASISTRILAAEIPTEAIIINENGSWSIRIEQRGACENWLPYMSICNLEVAKTLATIYNIMMPMIYGILFTISLYGFLLYLSKRDKMLLLFSLYTFCVFIWCFSYCLIDLFKLEGTLLPTIATYAFDFAVVLSMATCISFCETKLNGHWKLFGRWYGLLALCVLFSLVYNCLSAHDKSVFLFATYMVGGVVLIIACGKSERKPWIALGGLGITQALRFIALNYSTLSHPLSYYFELMKSMRLLTLPYVFGCMFYINSTFASRFSETEILAMKLKQANEILDRKVEERTSALVYQQQIKTNLLTNIFHDLRTPLFIMRGCMDKIKKENIRDHEAVRILDDRLYFITDMTEDLFATVKLEDKSLIMETEPVYLKPMLQEIVDSCQMDANKKGVGISYHSATENAATWGDEIWLARAFQNLISNALYYSRPDSNDVCVTIEVINDEIKICVTDYGVGIAPEDQDKIFDRYYRVSGAKKHKSSGLGLSIAASVIAHHNGRITVKSEVGKGTTFLVMLPLWCISADETK